MNRRRQPGLDGLLEDITVDCHGDGEVLTAFETAFDSDATLPCPGAVVGEDVKVLSVAASNGRHELVATCERLDRRYHVALLDVVVHGERRHHRPHQRLPPLEQRNGRTPTSAIASSRCGYPPFILP